MTGFQFLGRLFEKLERMQTIFCVAALGAIVVVLSLEILLRQFLGINLQWALDLSALLMVWICFIGASMVYRRKGHIGIEVLVKLFPEGLQKMLNVVMYLLIGAGFVVLMIRAGSLMLVQRGQEIVSLGISRSFLSFPVVLGTALMLVTSVYLILEELLRSGDPTAHFKKSGEEGHDESY
jgi:TRAP-type C4-dicarboxylate transport system permease small subunit